MRLLQYSTIDNNYNVFLTSSQKQQPFSFQLHKKINCTTCFTSSFPIKHSDFLIIYTDI